VSTGDSTSDDSEREQAIERGAPLLALGATPRRNRPLVARRRLVQQRKPAAKKLPRLLLDDDNN
jgi:hypothetical protein